MSPESPTAVINGRYSVLIQIIVVLGALSTTVITNWDKMFGTTVEATYSGYQPTGIFETELRYFLEISGQRMQWNASFEISDQKLIQKLNDLYDGDNDDVRSVFDKIKKDQITFDDYANLVLPVYKKYYEIEEIQALNKFYSTKIMQGMVRKMDSYSKELTPIFQEIMENEGVRVADIINEHL